MNKTSSQEQRIDDLKSELAKITKELSKAPNGSLNAVKTSNGFKYFQIEKNHGTVKRTYIKKEKIALATALAKKRYNKVRKKEIENEIASIKLKLDRTPKISSADLLYNIPGYSNLLQALLNPNYIKQQKWLSQPYIHNDKHQETLRFKTSAGITVRSKSETLIVRGLSDYSIPFKYECGLEINGTIYFPDFTIYKASEDIELIWEHFGMMDNTEYRFNAMNKLNSYINKGYVPGHNLICTFETINSPLTEDIIKRTIEAYLLDKKV